MTIVRTSLPARVRSALYGRLPTYGACLAAALAALGCSGDRDAMDKRLKELQQELTRVQNGNDRLEERVSSLELSRHVIAQSQPASAGAPVHPDRLERPPLKIVKLVPGSRPNASHSDAENDASSSADAAQPAGAHPVDSAAGGAEESESESGPRPVIRGRGARVEKGTARGRTSGKAWSGGKARGAKKGPNSVQSEPTGGGPAAESK